MAPCAWHPPAYTEIAQRSLREAPKQTAFPQSVPCFQIPIPFPLPHLPVEGPRSP